MAFLNQCNFFGNAGRSAEMKQSKDGSKSWAEFSIGVSVGSAAMPKTMWVKCRVFGKGTDRVMQQVAKGTQVYVSGRIDVSAYIGKKTNEAMSDVSLMVNDFQILKAGQGQEAQPLPELEPMAIPVFDGNSNMDFGEIPF